MGRIYNIISDREPGIFLPLSNLPSKLFLCISSPGNEEVLGAERKKIFTKVLEKEDRGKRCQSLYNICS